MDLGFKQGEASTCVFWHQQRDIKALVHGDDFVSGTLVVVRDKDIMVGEDDDMAKEARVSFVRWHRERGRNTEEERRQDLNGRRC